MNYCKWCIKRDTCKRNKYKADIKCNHFDIDVEAYTSDKISEIHPLDITEENEDEEIHKN